MPPRRPAGRCTLATATLTALLAHTAPTIAATFEPLGVPASPGALGSLPTDVSGDGAVVVGKIYDEIVDDDPRPNTSFRWSDGTITEITRCELDRLRISDDARTIAGACTAPTLANEPAVLVDGSYQVVPLSGDFAGGYVSGVSGDGLVLFGNAGFEVNLTQDSTEVFRVAGGTPSVVGRLPGDLASYFVASSFDGSAAAIESRLQDLDAESDDVHGARFAPGAPLQNIGSGGGEVGPTDISSDGATIVGDSSTIGGFRWRSETGMEELPLPFGALGVVPLGVSGDGAVIVGTYGEATGNRRAFVWTEADGARDLQDLFQVYYGVDFQGWQLQAATAISTDGSTIVGIGFPPLSSSPSGWRFSRAGVEGTVRDRDDHPQEGITFTLTGTEYGGGDVSLTASSNTEGRYVFAGVKPGTYKVAASGDPDGENGGTLSAAGILGGSCPGQLVDGGCQLDGAPNAPVNFVYTPCSAPERHPNDAPPTNCPIVFVPGFLGTRVVCGQEELWPGIIPFEGEFEAEFGKMALQSDGYTNAGDACATAEAVPGREGLVALVAGQLDIYNGAATFLDTIAPDRWVAYTYDWRRAVPVSVAGLDAAIDALLEDTGATRVVLMAHSMGGLVSRAYIDDPAHADKVSRFLTLGTPYWGAPKTHFALLGGDTDQPGSAFADLDLLTDTADLQRFARNAAGAFWLYPSANFGPWLSLSGVEQGAAGTNAWIAALGGTPALYDAARAGHATIDGFVTNGIDYRVMVGVGLPTVQHIGVREELVGEKFVRIGQWADLTFASGDSTVPARSATQGATDTGTPLGESVPIHYACGVGHVALPGDPGVDARVRKFLLRGEPIEGPENNCPYSGVQVRSFLIDILQAEARIRLSRASATARGAGDTLPVLDAARRGLAGLHTVGDRTTVVLDTRTGAALDLGGGHQPLQVRTIDSAGDGPWRSYAAGDGPLSIDTTGAVTSDGKPARELKLKKKPPRTKARIKKKRDIYLVRLRTRAPNGVGATVYRIGADAVVRYEKPFPVTKEELARLEYASVDLFGTQEPWRRARKR